MSIVCLVLILILSFLSFWQYIFDHFSVILSSVRSFSVSLNHLGFDLFVVEGVKDVFRYSIWVHSEDMSIEIHFSLAHCF